MIIKHLICYKEYRPSALILENEPKRAQIRSWQQEARLARPAEPNWQPLSLSGLLTDPPMLPTPAGVLTRHTGTLLTINDLRSNNPAHVPAQTGTNPTHGPWGATRTAWLGAQNELGRVGALDRSDAAGTQQMKGGPMYRLWPPCQQTFQKLICAPSRFKPQWRLAASRGDG